ncbi:MAG TPA: rhomboid family intramembrane serine protease, partial [Thermoanaerobaculia bacterium]
LKIFAAIVLATLVATAIAIPQSDHQDTIWIVLVAAFTSALVVIPLFLYHRQSQRPGVLRIEPSQIAWRDAVLGGEVALPYREIWSARKEGRGRWESLALRAGKTSRVRIPTAYLPEPGTADTVLETVRERISQLPERPQRPPRARLTFREWTSFGWKTATFAVSAFLAGVFLIELATGALTDPSRIWAFGASSSALVRHGELFRLATANFLHAGLEHFLITTVLLFSLGSLLESRLGGGRFLTILLVSALVGTAGSAFLGHQALAFGPSTGIAGLGGACAVMEWRWPSKPGNPVTRWIWIVLLVLLIRPLPQPQSFDITGPLIGFLTGAALMLSEARTATLAELKSRRRNLFRGTAALLIALFLVAGGIALRRAGDSGHSTVSHLR